MNESILQINSTASSWFAERRHYVSPRFLMRLFLVSTTIELLVIDLWFAFGGPIIIESDTFALYSNPDCPQLGTPILFSNAIAGMLVPTGFYRFPCVFMDFHGLSWVLSGSHGLFWK